MLSRNLWLHRCLSGRLHRSVHLHGHRILHRSGVGLSGGRGRGNAGTLAIARQIDHEVALVLVRPLLGIARGPVAERAELEHVGEHAREEDDEHHEHEIDDEDHAADRENAREGIVAVGIVVTVRVAVAVAIARKGTARDQGEDERDEQNRDDGDKEHEDLGEHGCAEELAELLFAGLPDLVERERALGAAGHGQVHDGGARDHAEEDAEAKGRQREHAAQQVVQGIDGRCGVAVVRVAHIRLKEPVETAVGELVEDRGRHPGDQREHERQGGPEHTERERRRAQKRLVNVKARATGKIATPLDGITRSAEGDTDRSEQADRAENPADNGDDHGKDRDHRDKRRQKGDLADAREHALDRRDVGKGLPEAALCIDRGCRDGRHLGKSGRWLSSRDVRRLGRVRLGLRSRLRLSLGPGFARRLGRLHLGTSRLGLRGRAA